VIGWLAQSVPDPGTAWLIGQGALGLGCLAEAAVVRILWKEAQALRERERETVREVYGKILPIMDRNVEVMSTMTEAFKDLNRELKS